MCINFHIRKKYFYPQKSILLTLSCLLSLIITSAAQEPSYFSITTEDGLPSNDVYVIHQDSIGFLWFATEDGICKYDGSEFEYFDHSALIDNDIIGLEIDKDGRIWCWNMKGQLAYIEENKVKLFDIGDTLSQFKIIAFKIDSR